MELVEGGSVRKLMVAGKSLPPNRANQIIRAAAAGVDHAHENGILHRDIKPGNLLLDANGVVKVADFGLAKIDGVSQELTPSRVLLGTTSFMAPELLAGKSATRYSDQWALAVTAYLLLTGSLPFIGENPEHLIKLILDAAPEAPSHLNPNLRPTVNRVFVRAFDRTPEKRYPSCCSFASALAESLKYSSEITTQTLTSPVPSRSRWITAAAWVCALLIAGGLASRLVFAPPPVLQIVRFEADPQTVKSNAPVTIRWETRNADAAEIDGVGTVEPKSGSTTVAPEETTTYHLTLRRGSNTLTRAVTVAVTRQALEIVRFDADRLTVPQGDTVTFHWEARNGESAEITNVGTVDPRSGTARHSPSDTLKYSLTVRRGAEKVVREVTITVTKFPARILSFIVEPQAVLRGKTAKLIWKTENAKRVRITGLGDVRPSDESDVTPTESTTYVVTAHDGHGNELKSEATVEVGDGPKIARFGATTGPLATDQRANLSWQVENADEVTISGIGAVQPTGNLRVQADRDTRYTLVANNRFDRVQRTISVYREPSGPTLSECRADPATSPRPGALVMISFRVENASSVTLNGVEPVRSPFRVQPTKDTAYKIVATGRGEAACDLNVAVAPPPAPPQTASPGEIWKNERDGLDYVWIPAGSFLMGCSPLPTPRALPGFLRKWDSCENNEKPAHTVAITKGYWLGQSEVTVGAYKRFVGSGAARMPRYDGRYVSVRVTNLDHPEPGDGVDPDGVWVDRELPMVDVTWKEANTFCGWSNGRLPTEAEWEYAARAGTVGPRYGELDQIAWYVGNTGLEALDGAKLWAADRTKDKEDYRKQVVDGNHNALQEVKSKAPNRWMLYDMLGNVWEWTADWLYDYRGASAGDPTGPINGQFRAVRGGSFEAPDNMLRVSVRRPLSPDSRQPNLGWRCVVQ